MKILKMQTLVKRGDVKTERITEASDLGEYFTTGARFDE